MAVAGRTGFLSSPISGAGREKEQPIWLGKGTRERACWELVETVRWPV